MSSPVFLPGSGPSGPGSATPVARSRPLPGRSSSRSFSAGSLVVPALTAAVLLPVLWLWQQTRQENQVLRAELAQLTILHRRAVSRSTESAATVERAARLEQALEMVRRNGRPEAPAAASSDPVPVPVAVADAVADAVAISAETSPAATPEESPDRNQENTAPEEKTDAARAQELERVISFLREEINAAHETIERLKQEGPGAGR